MIRNKSIGQIVPFSRLSLFFSVWTKCIKFGIRNSNKWLHPTWGPKPIQNPQESLVLRNTFHFYLSQFKFRFSFLFLFSFSFGIFNRFRNRNYSFIFIFIFNFFLGFRSNVNIQHFDFHTPRLTESKLDSTWMLLKNQNLILHIYM